MQNDIDLKALLQHMRQAREGLVTQQAQYNFCYESIAYGLRLKRIEKEMGIGSSGTVGVVTGCGGGRLGFGSGRLNAPPNVTSNASRFQKSRLGKSSHCIPNHRGLDQDD